MRITTEAPNPKTRLDATDMRYTPVLTKQSAMFNAWKLLCELSDTYKVPVRMCAMYAHAETLKGGIRPDRIRRLEGISLQKLYASLDSS